MCKYPAAGIGLGHLRTRKEPVWMKGGEKGRRQSLEKCLIYDVNVSLLGQHRDMDRGQSISTKGMLTPSRETW